MRRLVLMALGLFVFAQCAVAAAEQATEAKSDTSVQTATADPRLSEKITYEGGYKRLHEVTDDLTRQTGVKIRSGKNDSDWPVRDIPLVVCVRDMPLGRLLRLLALTSHAEYTQKQLPGQTAEERTYRISRGVKQEKELVSVQEKRRDARLAMAEWSWDALVKLGNSPDTVGGNEESRLIGKILASLGLQGKKKAFAGDEIILPTKDCPQAGLVQDLCRWAFGMGQGCDGKRVPAQADLDCATLHLYIADATGELDMTNVYLSLWPTSWLRSLRLGDGVAEKLDLPPRPVEGSQPRAQDEMTDKGLEFLDKNKDGDWKRKSLQESVKLTMPEGKKYATSADLLTALSKAAGFNIVCEDFASHRWNSPGDMSSSFGQKAELGAALRKTADYTDWFINDEQKLLVGWAENWRKHHSRLVSADYLAGLCQKLDGDGLQLDDITPLANIMDGQFFDWIDMSCDLVIWGGVGLGSAWKLYDMMGPEDKAQAKSEAGLSLGEFDPQGIATFCRQQSMQRLPWSAGKCCVDETDQPGNAEKQRTDRSLSDPKLVSTLVMRVKSELVTDAPESLKYRMELEGVERDQIFKIDVPGPGIAFPVYSSKRKAEILKEKTGTETK